MSFQEINFELVSRDRKTMRTTLISAMLNEEPGNGNGDLCSRYQYNVENFQEYGIFLKRPTQLNKGFDFTVNTKGLWFKKIADILIRVTKIFLMHSKTAEVIIMRSMLVLLMQ